MRTLWDAILLIAVAALLFGCQAAPPKVPDVVRIPIPVACLPIGDIPKPPAIASNAELRAMDAYDRLRIIAAERAELLAWLTDVLPLLEACARAPSVDNFRHRTL
jgi:hypothetical protein